MTPSLCMSSMEECEPTGARWKLAASGAKAEKGQIMNEKPLKHLVHKGRYVWVMTLRATLMSTAVLLLIFGVTAIILSYWINSTGLYYWLGSTGLQTEQFCALVAPAIIFLAFRVYKWERHIERVKLITTQNLDLIPPEDCLVRASDLPPSQQKAELLRAVRQGAETPAEELLRAGQGSNPDV
jgi:hypothetical protein